MWKQLATVLILALILCLRLPSFADEAKMEAQIQKLGGRLERDSKLPGKPIVKVDLQATNAKDADLAGLKELKSLRILYLGHGTPTTDSRPRRWGTRSAIRCRRNRG